MRYCPSERARHARSCFSLALQNGTHACHVYINNQRKRRLWESLFLADGWMLTFGATNKTKQMTLQLLSQSWFVKVLWLTRRTLAFTLTYSVLSLDVFFFPVHRRSLATHAFRRYLNLEYVMCISVVCSAERMKACGCTNKSETKNLLWFMKFFCFTFLWGIFAFFVFRFAIFVGNGATQQTTTLRPMRWCRLFMSSVCRRGTYCCYLWLDISLFLIWIIAQ